MVKYEWIKGINIHISGVTGSSWNLSIVFWKLSIALIMFKMTWQRYIVQLSSTEETLANQDWVRYSTNELKVHNIRVPKRSSK